MKTTVRDTRKPLLERLVIRGAALVVEALSPVATERRLERYGNPSGMIKLRLTRAASLAEAQRRATRSPGGAP